MTSLDLLFRKIRDSFSVQDTQTIIMVLVVFLFTVLLLLSPLLLRRLWKRKIRRRAIDQYRALADLYRLDGDDEKVLEQLSQHLRNPWKKYLLITNPRTYMEVLHRLKRDFETFTANEQKLAQKLQDRNYDQFRCPDSTMQFQQNHQIIIIDRNRTLVARITASDDTAFECERVSGHTAVSSGSQVLLLYPYGNGLAVGNTVIEALKGNRIKLLAVDMDKPADIDYEDLDVPVYIRKVTLGTSPVPAILKHIKGYDFILKVEEERLKKRSDIKIFFLPEKGSVPVNAEVTARRKARVVATAGYLKG
ncbi:MAG: hypothetical protein JW874_00830 [Spirochaetales bacterium]|nr:hypothetical protein [Spirochaetales bacterium]